MLSDTAVIFVLKDLEHLL